MSVAHESDFRLRMGLPRRWTCEGLTQGAEVSNSINKIRKKIELPLYSIKGLSQTAFNRMLRYAKAMDHLRSAVVDAIIIKSIHRLVGLTRKEMRQQVDVFVERHLKNLPMKVKSLRFGVSDVMGQMRLMLKYKRHRLPYAVSCRSVSCRSDGSGAVTATVVVVCADRLMLFAVLPSVVKEIGVAISDVEAMNLKNGLLMDSFDIELKPEFSNFTPFQLEKVLDEVIPRLSCVEGVKAAVKFDPLKCVSNLRLMMRIELWDAALLVVMEDILGVKSNDIDLSMLTSNMVRFDKPHSVVPASLVRMPRKALESRSTLNSSETPMQLELDDITVVRGLLINSRISSYEGMLKKTGERIFIKGTEALLNDLVKLYEMTHNNESNAGILEFKPSVNNLVMTLSSDAIAKRIEYDREVNAMCHVGRHKNICRCIGYCNDARGMIVCYEFIEGGNLTDLIRDVSKGYKVLSIARDIAEGMSFLHNRGVMHRDLKSSNIVITRTAVQQPEEADEACQVSCATSMWEGCAKVADFGLSCVVDGCRDMTAETGTYRWMAPEIIRHEPYSFAADVYSFGILLWELISRDHPYAGLTPIQAAFSVAKHGLRPVVPSGINPRLKAIMVRCWHPVPSARPTFSDIVDLLSCI